MFCKVFLVNSHNLLRVYMKCNYKRLNHNLLVSPKKVITKGMNIKKGYSKTSARNVHSKISEQNV
jgi:hypothetical protein